MLTDEHEGIEIHIDVEDIARRDGLGSGAAILGDIESVDLDLALEAEQTRSSQILTRGSDFIADLKVVERLVVLGILFVHVGIGAETEIEVDRVVVGDEIEDIHQAGVFIALGGDVDPEHVNDGGDDPAILRGDERVEVNAKTGDRINDCEDVEVEVISLAVVTDRHIAEQRGHYSADHPAEETVGVKIDGNDADADAVADPSEDLFDDPAEVEALDLPHLTADGAIEEILSLDGLGREREHGSVVIKVHDIQREVELLVAGRVISDILKRIDDILENVLLLRGLVGDIPGVLSTVVILFVVAGDEEHAAGEADHEDGDHGKKNLFLHNLLLIINSAQKKPTLTLHNTTAGA